MTIRKSAHLIVDPDRLSEALQAIRTLVAHTGTEEGTLLYRSWQSVREPTEFLHLMEFVDARSEQLHATSEAVKAFTDALYPLCIQMPTFREWTSVP